MMLYPAMNELLEQVPSRYKLVNVVAARARQIANEAESNKDMLDDKPVSIAIREIAEGKMPDFELSQPEPTAMETAFLTAESEQEEADAAPTEADAAVSEEPAEPEEAEAPETPGEPESN